MSAISLNTKAVIAETFKELIHHENVDKITVKQLIQECHISRQTFYYHFQDIVDVMEWSIRRQTEQLLEESLKMAEMRTALLRLISFTIEQFPVLQKIMCSQHRSRFEHFMATSMQNYLIGLVQYHHQELAVNPVDKETFLHYNAYGIVGMLLEYCGTSNLEPDILAAQLERILLGQLRG